MSTSPPPHETIVCNTTPVRIFAVVGQFDLLADVLGGNVRAPRQVFDPDDDFAGPPNLLSEIGQAQRFFAGRSTDPEAGESWERLAALRTRTDIESLDLSETEIHVYAELVGPDFIRSRGLAVRLGRGEAAAMSIAKERGWAIAMDDRVARNVLSDRSPTTEIVTSRELLVRAVAHDHANSAAAQLIYDDMLAKGYRGPKQLF